MNLTFSIDQLVRLVVAAKLSHEGGNLAPALKMLDSEPLNLHPNIALHIEFGKEDADLGWKARKGESPTIYLSSLH